MLVSTVQYFWEKFRERKTCLWFFQIWQITIRNQGTWKVFNHYSETLRNIRIKYNNNEWYVKIYENVDKIIGNLLVVSGDKASFHLCYEQIF